MALGLNNAFKQAVLSNAEDALRNQILLLISNVDVIDGQLLVPQVLSEPRLSQTDSDLYAQIYNQQGELLWRSASLLDAQMPTLSKGLGEFEFFATPSWPGHQPVYAMTLGIEWETAQGDLPLTVQVSEASNEYAARLREYQQTVGLWLLVIGAALLGLLLLVLNWALKPLNRVTKQVAEIERGARQRFAEDYPEEVSRLTQNLNQLLNFEEQRIERHKQVLGNLAHSLKTPIAVLSGLNYSADNKAEAQQQLDTMRTIIDYQLQSASAVGRRRFARPISIASATAQIIASLDKLQRDKQLQVELQIDDNHQFYGDLGDWMELAGNLLDNAYKWANSKIVVIVQNQPLPDSASHRKATVLQVIDDGDGINEQLKETILQRGIRLDSQAPGHGLGLHIVKGIVEAYEGEIDIHNAEPRGTHFRLRLN